MAKKYEDSVRSRAGHILGFVNNIGEALDTPEYSSGVGQITTFNQLGFPGINDKPDGWYLPADLTKPAIILETKSESESLWDIKWEKELFKNLDITATKYSKIIGILYNGIDIRVFKDKTEVLDAAKTLQQKEYYLALYDNNTLDKDRIYNLTRRINDCLHCDFKMNDLKDRMVFTACALVAQRFAASGGKDLTSQKGQTYDIVKMWIRQKLALAIDFENKSSAIPNKKLDLLITKFEAISVATEAIALDSVIDAVCEISELINSNAWNGEDVMAIFFNEFTRYGGKPSDGQVFTPEHIASFMYRLIDIHQNDCVLDATCGSGTFLVKAMSNMIKEAGGYNTQKAKDIMSQQLYGIEFDPSVYALACANMLIHKDGKTNLEQLDTRKKEACGWIKSKNITKVLMNPPYERKYGCMPIVTNVLNNVPEGTLCAFILPDKKLEKDNGAKLLANHRLTHIIKLPENLFFGIGVTTSVFVFKAGVKQDGTSIRGYYIEDDGLETVKNKGRQDVRGRWPAIEDYWIKAIQDDNDYQHCTRQLINPAEHLSYQMPEPPFELYEEDFMRTMMDYLMFAEEIDAKTFKASLAEKALYSDATLDTHRGNGL